MYICFIELVLFGPLKKLLFSNPLVAYNLLNISVGVKQYFSNTDNTD